MLLRVYIFLAISSISVIVWQHLGMNTRLHFDKSSSANAISDETATNDPALSSSTELITTDAGKLLTCEIKTYYQYPFCEISISLSTHLALSLDVNSYENIRLKVAYTPPKMQDNLNLRLQIRSFDANGSNFNNIESFKVNEKKLNINAPGSLEELVVSLDEFTVPTWWSSMMLLKKNNGLVNLQHSVLIKIMTPEDTLPGKHALLLESISFEGKLISQHTLIYILSSVWLLVIVFNIFIVIRHNYIKTKKLVLTQKELKKINGALSIEAQELKDLVTRDHLTGIRNRYGIRDLILELVSKTENDGFNFSAMYLDLDKFKLINDNYGHDIGDKVLIAFSQLISKNIRSNDIFARCGGEEFILISPEFGYTKARLLAEKLRQMIEKETWPENIDVTCSIGLTEYKSGEDISDLLKRADTALYESKAKGRNRTTVL